MIEFVNISKAFGGVHALRGVSLSIARGECHALMGENGAGKSTLGKVLAGIHQPDSGEVRIDGGALHLKSPADAARAGIGMVHQELAFCPDLSVAENLSMGAYPRRGFFVDRTAMRAKARELLQRIGITLDVDQPMRRLSTAQEQMVQIASAVGTGARILVFDEPTSSLSEAESQALFRLIENLKAAGVTIIYVSHRMPEVFRLSDAISVLRDGQYVGTLKRGGDAWDDVTRDDVVRMMIGRELAAAPPTVRREFGSVMLRVDALSRAGRFEDVTFDIRAGEILGFAGLVGSGRSEIAQAVFGLDAAAQGVVRVAGAELRRCVRAAMAAGVGLVPEDRKRQGLVLMDSGRMNFALPSLQRFSRAGFVRRAIERQEAVQLFERLRVKTPSLEAPVQSMSGGNQQKVVIAKWLARGGNVLIVDEPTRGVDVGAKAAIHELLRALAAQGLAIMLISSELPEVLALSDRIVVMREGRQIATLSRDEADQDKLIRLMAGVT